MCLNVSECVSPLGFLLVSRLTSRTRRTSGTRETTTPNRMGRIKVCQLSGEGAEGEDGEAEEVGGEVVAAGFSKMNKDCHQQHRNQMNSLSHFTAERNQIKLRK